jgi:hypothetical protein
MDAYSKVIFTVIAVALVAIAPHLWSPREATAAPFGLSATTFGDFLDLSKIKDPKEREEASVRATRNMLVVRVQGAFVSAQ